MILNSDVVGPCLFIFKNPLRAPVWNVLRPCNPLRVRPTRSSNLVHNIVVAVTKANGLYVFTQTNNNPTRTWTAAS